MEDLTALNVSQSGLNASTVINSVVLSVEMNVSLYAEVRTATEQIAKKVDA